jgi:RhtB (resistance to homoserine/threonine) family protein
MNFLSNYWVPFLEIMILNTVVMASPGPDFAITAKNSLLYTRKAGLLTVVGICCGECLHLTYTILGFGFIISRTLWLFHSIRILGAVYLVYIGWKALKARPMKKNKGETPTGEKNFTSLDAFRMGLFTNLLNPKAIFFFLSIFTGVVGPETPLPIMIFYGAVMTLETFLWFGLVAIFFSNQGVQEFFSSYRHWIERVTGTLLISLGLKLAFFTDR